MDATNRRHSMLSGSPPPYPPLGWVGAPAIVAEHMSRAGSVRALGLSDLSFCVGQGDFFGLVGPPGAGKTSLIRVLATLLPRDAGRLSILGLDATTEIRKIRRAIGYAGQSNGLDERLTGRENLMFVARLHGLRHGEASRLADDILARLELSTLARRTVHHYSASARGLLALGCALIHQPRLLLLDNPTAGMAPSERQLVWSILEATNLDQGVTIVLSTDQLGEAERLCRHVAILDSGKILAMGTPSELKAQVSGVTIVIHLASDRQVETAVQLLDQFEGIKGGWSHLDYIELEAVGASVVPVVVRVLEEYEIEIRDIALSKPSLDEVFFRHTGRKLHDSEMHAMSDASVPFHG